MLEATIYYLLKKHFCRGELLCRYSGALPRDNIPDGDGFIDLITAPEDEVDLSMFSLKKCILFPLTLCLC